MSKRRFSFGLNVVSAIMVVCILAMPVMAQESEAIAPAPKHSLRDGAWALQFQIGENFTLTNFEGLTISGKHHLSDKRALRVGVALYLSGSSGDTKRNYSSQYQDGVNILEDLDTSESLVEVDGKYIHYSSLYNKANLYLGLGPYLRFSHISMEVVQNLPDSGFIEDYRRWSRGHSWSTGVSCVLGVEWSISRSIGILAEYGLSVGYLWSRQRSSEFNRDPYRLDTRNSSSGSWNIRSNAVKFGLSVYF
jgi:hypothetical protein